MESVVATARIPMGLMSTARPVVVAETFILHPAQRQSWSEFVEAVRRGALSNAACLSFRLMRDRNNDSLAVLLSEWTNIHEFNRFVRESGLLWLERGIHPSLAGTWLLLEPVDDGTGSPSVVPPLITRQGKSPIGITGVGSTVARTADDKSGIERDEAQPSRK
jgi:quinol monooxygenase YgiN